MARVSRPMTSGGGFALVVVMTLLLGLWNDLLFTRIQQGYYPSVALSRALREDLAGTQRALQDAAAARDGDQLTAADSIVTGMRATLRAAHDNPTLVRRVCESRHGIGEWSEGADAAVDSRVHRILVGLMALIPAVAGAQAGWITVDSSVSLFYRVQGQGRDTIIAIHGGPGVDLESIANDFAPLTEHHTVIFYDQRGTGRSSLPKDTTTLTAANQISDLDAVRRYFHLNRVTLVAHSYGPLLAATYALAHPEAVRRMVFFNPVPPRRGDFWQRFGKTMATRLDTNQRVRLAELQKRLDDPASGILEDCRAFWAIALRPRLAEPDSSLSRIKSDLCASDPVGIRYGLTVTNRLVMASYGDWDLREPLRKLAVPLLVVHGEEDAIPMDLVQEWVTSMPHARLLKVPNAAHFSYVEQPGIVWPAVETFLTER